jgi:hypothetical protein
MPGKTRVLELAKELNVPISEVVGRLAELGEYGKTTASTIEAPVAQRLRESYSGRGHRPWGTPRPRRPANPDTPFGVVNAPGPGTESVIRRHGSPTFGRPRAARREWHRGEAPRALATFLLNKWIVPAREPDAPLPRTMYWDDEVKKANEYVARWAGCRLDGLLDDDILNWILVLTDPSGRNWLLPELANAPECASRLHSEGVRPSDVGWSYDDKGRGTLAERLRRGQLTTEQVILEARARNGTDA